MLYFSIAHAERKTLEALLKEHEQKETQTKIRSTESRWIYEKLKSEGHFQEHEDTSIKEKIFFVLSMIHEEHLELMHIYYYRKNLYSRKESTFDLEILWKIEQYDKEWSAFSDMGSKISKNFENIQSFVESSQTLREMLDNCTDVKILKYFKDYENFILARVPTLLEGNKRKKKSVIEDVVLQITERKVGKWL